MSDQGHWSPEVVAAISRHMNDEHGEDNVLIVRHLGGVPDATSAVMTGMGPAGIAFAAELPDGSDRIAVVPWPAVPVDRADVRRQVVAMHEAAVAASSTSDRIG